MFGYSVMLIKFFDRIAVRLIFSVTLVAIVVASFSAYIFFERSYLVELEKNRTSLQQLVQAVSNTAAIATYLEDAVLANEVVVGIAANNLVKSVALKTDAKLIANSGDIKNVNKADLMYFTLKSPFIKTESIGELIVEVNVHSIKAYAKSTALEHVALMAIHSLFLIFVIMFMIKYQLVDVIKNLARKLHHITPGSAQRIQIPFEHERGEIGLLAGDINQLLESVQNTLNSERSLRTEVEELERRFRNIFEQTSGGIALIDHHGYLKVHNPSFEKIVGQSRMDRLGVQHKESLFSVLGAESLTLQKSVAQALAGGKTISVDLKIVDNKDVRWVHCMISKMIDDADVPMLEIIIQDVSERRNREHHFKIQAEIDPLTSLYNRRAGKEKIQKVLDASENVDIEYALLMIDLDDFKPINDKYGHKAGDIVLTVLAKRLIKHVRTEDIVIRWGGDEILMFVKQHNNGLDVTSICHKLTTVIQEPIIIDEDKMVSVGASIGYATYPINGFELDMLIERADEAMYLAKAQTKAQLNLDYQDDVVANDYDHKA